MLLFNPQLVFYLLVAALPAWLMNRYLLKWLQPRRSFKHFLLYLLAVLSVAFLYTFIITWVLLKYVWTVK
jgi:hypothetical protein